MYRLIRPLLFLLDAERAHRVVTRLFKAMLWLPLVGRWIRWRHRCRAPELAQDLLGLRFENPVGLAAGFDKNAEIFDEMSALGFGFVEIGTVTARAQPGNPKPRLFRLPRDKALINRFGFNNDGAAEVAKRLTGRALPIPLGVNIGRSKVVSNEQAIDDYLESLETLWSYASYITVNVSSPNTPELRALQTRDRLGPLLDALRGRLGELAEAADRQPPPLLLKVAPDLSDDELVEVCEVIRERAIDGIIATNTTISRDGLTTPAIEVEKLGAGGLSGPPLAERSLEVVRKLREQLGADVPIIASGGIFDAEGAWRALQAGARLIQVYTGLIYNGPGFVKAINQGLLRRLRERGISSVAEVAEKG